jgi:hypothetical protein
MSIINKPLQHVKREYELEEPVALAVERDTPPSSRARRTTSSIQP